MSAHRKAASSSQNEVLDFYRESWREAVANADFDKSEAAFAALKVDPDDIADKFVLEAGCGIGGPAVAMARKYGAKVTGVDLSPVAIELARDTAARAGVAMDLKIGDIMGLAGFADASFDAVVSIGTVYCTPDPFKCLTAFRRVLRPGGVVYISVLRDCWIVRRRPLMRAVMDALPEPLQRVAFRVMEILIRLITGGTASKQRVNSIRAGLHEAFENTFQKAYRDAVWQNWLTEAGFSGVELVCHWNVLKQHSVYRGRVRR